MLWHKSMNASEQTEEPRGALAVRTVAMPADANPNGDMFGGWLLAQMDIAGGLTAERRAHGRVVTVAVEGMSFHSPVRVGDQVSCYAEVRKVGTTSLTIGIEAWAQGRNGALPVRVTQGLFTYVAIDEHGRKRLVPHE